MTEPSEYEAVSRLINKVMWDAEEDHYSDSSGNMDRDIHGRVYALWDLGRALDRWLVGIPSPSRSQILEVLDSILRPLEAQLGARPDALGRDLGGRVIVLREVRASIAAGEHMAARPE